jgi:hypothetical protein
VVSGNVIGIPRPLTGYAAALEGTSAMTDENNPYRPPGIDAIITSRRSWRTRVGWFLVVAVAVISLFLVSIPALVPVAQRTFSFEIQLVGVEITGGSPSLLLLLIAIATPLVIGVVLIVSGSRNRRRL